jgi:hypothetical protein
MEEHLLHPSKRISQFAPQRLKPVELRQALAQFLLVMTQVRTHMSVENIATAKKLALIQFA